MKNKNNRMQEFPPFRALKFFMENPYQEVYLRQLAKELKLSAFATKKYADILVKESLLKEERKANLRYFRANVSNLFFRHLKIAFSINFLLKLGLLEFLKEKIPNVSSIILFGSVAKGEDDKSSDVDILVIGKRVHVDMTAFEEKSRRINLHVFSWSEWNRKAKNDMAFYFEVISHYIALFGELPLITEHGKQWK